MLDCHWQVCVLCGLIVALGCGDSSPAPTTSPHAAEDSRAIAEAERLLREQSAALGPEHWEVVDLRLDVSRRKLVAKFSEEDRKLWEETRVIEAKFERLSKSGGFKEAVALAEELRDLRAVLFGDDHQDYADALHNLAYCQKQLGKHGLARENYELALAIRGKTLGESHPDYAATLSNVGILRKTTGDFAGAEKDYQRALEIYRATLGDSHQDYATALNNLAYLFLLMNDYARAEPLMLQSLEIHRTVDATSLETATAINNLALLYEMHGDYARAVDLFQQAIAIDKQLAEGRHPNYARDLNNFAVFYSRMGDLTRSRQLFEQTAEVSGAALGESSPEYTMCLANLAFACAADSDHAAAERLYERVLEINRNTNREKHYNHATAINGLAQVFVYRGEFERAETLFRQSIDIARNGVGEKHPFYGLCVNNLASLYEAMGDHVRARPLVQEAMKVHADARGLSLLARIDAAQGETAKAELLFGSLLKVQADELRKMSIVQSERQQIAAQASMRQSLDDYLQLCASKPEWHEKAYRQLLAWKGAVLRRQRLIRAADDTPTSAALFVQLQSAASRLAALGMQAPAADQSEAWQRQTTELSQEKDRLERELAAASATYREALRELTLEEFQAMLPESSVFIDWLFIAPEISAARDGSGPTAPARRLMAFVVRPGAAVRLVECGEADEVIAQIDAWRQGMGATDASIAAGAWLRERLWTALSPWMEGATLALVSPDEALGRLPLAALPGKSPGSYLLEDIAIGTIPAAALFDQLSDDRTTSSAVPTLLALGDVDYNSVKSTADPTSPPGVQPAHASGGRRAVRWGESTPEFAALPETVAEIDSMTRLFEVAYGAGHTQVLRGAEANEESFRKATQRHRFLHLATHGFFAPEQLQSALVTRRRPANSLGVAPVEILGLHPGLLSGLALAGVNQTTEAGRHDGILTADEVSTLSLSDVDLAVLSACDTGLGQAAGGEGLLGLQRAFQVSGARTVVSTLWSVDSLATQLLMSRFYDNLWRRKMGRLESLREAQLWMLREGALPLRQARMDARARGIGEIRETREIPPPESNSTDVRLPPDFWAAFVLSGDWR